MLQLETPLGQDEAIQKEYEFTYSLIFFFCSYLQVKKP
jgi:hypothetical protein